MTMLDTGDVLTAAGYDAAGPTTVTELYNEAPTTPTTPTPSPTPAPGGGERHNDHVERGPGSAARGAGRLRVPHRERVAD